MKDKNRILTRSRIKLLVYALALTFLLFNGILMISSDSIGFRSVSSSGTINYGQSNSWTFVQLTDPQWGAHENSESTESNTWNAIRFVNENAEEYNIKFVIVTGDLIDELDDEYPTPTYYPQIRSALDTLAVSYYTCMGNHDGTRGETYEEHTVEHSDLYLEFFGDHQTDPTEVYYLIDYEDLRLVVMGQEIGYPGGPKDYLTSEELNFLNSSLETSQDCIVAFHQPLDWSVSGYEIGDPNEIAETIDEHPNCKLFICGHVEPPEPSYTSLGGFHQYVMPPTGNRWGVGYGYVTLFEVTEDSISMSLWRTSDDSFQYEASLVQTFTVILQDEPPNPPPNPSEPSVLEPWVPPAPDYIVNSGQSIQSVINSAPSGSAIYVEPGTYPGFSFNGKSLIVWGEPPTNAGPPSFPDSATVIDGNLGTVSTSLDSSALVDISNVNGGELRYMTLRNNWNGYNAAGIGASHADYVTIEFVNIYNCGGRGISWRGTDLRTGNIIRGCHLQNIAMGEGWGGGGGGIRLARSSGEVSYNWVEDTGEGGIGVSHFQNGPAPDYGYVHHNLVERAGGVGIEFGARDGYVSYNIVRDSCQFGSHNQFWIEPSASVELEWNIVDHFDPLYQGGYGSTDEVDGIYAPSSCTRSYNVVVNNGVGTAFPGGASLVTENYEVDPNTGDWISRGGGSHTSGPWTLPTVPWEWWGV